MIACRACGSQMFFDIPSQQLKCKHCGTMRDVKDNESETFMAETDLYETIQYTCTQCGAQLMSLDDEVLSFCSYCGTQGMMEGKFKNHPKPQRIIPFKKTKEEGFAAFRKRVKRAIYAPSDLQSKSQAEKFRGIYMPYWSYELVQNDQYDLHGDKSYRQGDYIVTDHYLLSGNIEAKYMGVAHDASSSFADTISENIGPFNHLEEQDFEAGYMHGFYADLADMDEYVYRQFAERYVNNYALSETKKAYPRFAISESPNEDRLNNCFKTRVTSVKSTMYPVWFMSYKSKGRISYATVNGETGKVYAEIPASLTKFFMGTLLVAALLYVLINQNLFLDQYQIMEFSGAIGLLVQFIFNYSLQSIINRERCMADGDHYKEIQKKQRMNTSITSIITAVYIIMILFVVVMGRGMIAIVRMVDSLVAGRQGMMPAILLFGVSLTLAILGQKKLNQTFQVNAKIATWLPVVTYATMVIVTIIQPVEDIWYYMSAIAIMAAIIVMLVKLITSYNILTTRMPKVFVRKGGDDLE